MTFFVASNGPGKGADLGGLEGADRQCQTLAQGAARATRLARLLSTQATGGAQAVNARDRIGRGPGRISRRIVAKTSTISTATTTNSACRCR